MREPFRHRRKYVAAMDGGVPQSQEHIAAPVGCVGAFPGAHAAERALSYRRRYLSQSAGFEVGDALG